MAAIQNTMWLAALLALQTLGGPPVKVSRKALPIRAGIDSTQHWITQGRRYYDDMGRCVEQQAPYRGAVPPHLCRFRGYWDALVEADGEPMRQMEITFNIGAHTVDEAFEMFDADCDMFLKSLQAGVDECRKKADAEAQRLADVRQAECEEAVRQHIALQESHDQTTDEKGGK